MTLATTISQTAQTINRNRHMRRVSRQLPLRAIHTAPSGKQSWFDVHEIEFDETSFDEQTGEFGVFWCKGLQYIETATGFMTLTRTVPSYTLNN